jgi:hypothetical protein
MDSQVSIPMDLAAERKYRVSVEIAKASGLDLDQVLSNNLELLWINRLLF